VAAVLRSGTDASSIESVIGGLTRAWNNGNALEFAGYFQEDADLVNIHGMHLRGRQAIAALYDMLFRSIFAASDMAITIHTTRFLSRTIALVHARIEFNGSKGSMAGKHDALTTALMVRESPHWTVAALTNTLVNAPAA
jgi:uncharacterized protein (TIGR02246 family)